MGDVIQVTDDEVVALALAHQVGWPSGIPTVEPDEQALREAAFRGRRSLYVRGLGVNDEGEPGLLQGLVRAIIESPGRLIVYLADDDYRRVGWGLASAHHAATDDWVFETVNPVGVHRLGWQPVDDHRTYVSSLLDGAVTSGPVVDDEQGTVATKLCVLAQGPSGAMLAAARRGEIRAGAVDISEGIPAASETEDVTCEAAVDRLFATAIAG